MEEEQVKEKIFHRGRECIGFWIQKAVFRTDDNGKVRHIPGIYNLIYIGRRDGKAYYKEVKIAKEMFTDEDFMMHRMKMLRASAMLWAKRELSASSI